MNLKCIVCNEKFKYAGAMKSFINAKSHCCSADCLTVKRTKHGLNRKGASCEDTKRFNMYKNAKNRVNKRNHTVFEINVEDIPKIPKICPVLSIKIDVNTHSITDNSPSLDRIDSNNGYVKGNLRIISNKANRLKSNATSDEILLIYNDLIEIENKGDCSDNDSI